MIVYSWLNPVLQWNQVPQFGMAGLPSRALFACELVREVGHRKRAWGLSLCGEAVVLENPRDHEVPFWSQAGNFWEGRGAETGAYGGPKSEGPQMTAIRKTLGCMFQSIQCFAGIDCVVTWFRGCN